MTKFDLFISIPIINNKKERRIIRDHIFNIHFPLTIFQPIIFKFPTWQNTTLTLKSSEIIHKKYVYQIYLPPITQLTYSQINYHFEQEINNADYNNYVLNLLLIKNNLKKQISLEDNYELYPSKDIFLMLDVKSLGSEDSYYIAAINKMEIDLAGKEINLILQNPDLILNKEEKQRFYSNGWGKIK